jgi:hypothetical protein
MTNQNMGTKASSSRIDAGAGASGSAWRTFRAYLPGHATPARVPSLFAGPSSRWGTILEALKTACALALLWLVAGCASVSIPKGVTHVQVIVIQQTGWRSAQGVATNNSNHVASGADFQVPLTGK